jgi:small subunit ribosomal protein S16
LSVRIRLQRHGRKKRPFYRLVAADSRSQRDGRFLEGLGYYNPLTDPAEIVVNEEKVLKWLKLGARPSDTAKNLLSKVGIWEKFINEKLGKPTPSREAEPPPENDPAPSAEEPAPTSEEETKEKTSSETTSEESEA